MRAAGFVLLGLVLVGSPLRSAPVDDAFAARAQAAIVEAVEARIGQPGAVVQSIAVTATPTEGALNATPAPDARTGRPSLFSLTVETAQGPRRVGSAVATVAVVADAVRARVTLGRGDSVTAADVERVRGPIGVSPLKRLPQAAEIDDAVAARPVAAGTVLTADLLRIAPSVRSGQQVRVRAVVGGIEAHGLGIASENGRLGAVIRVVNPDSRRSIRSRVVGRGEVEVIHGS
jgi:flagella basal body P-ring formation protein FlgA